MANNYFGFTPGGTQYSAQPAAAYPTAQTAYVTAQPAQTAYAAAAAPRAAQTYEAFQPAPSSGTYAYAGRTQVNVVLKPAYEQKTYYQPTAQPAYTVAAATDTVYQAAKPAYVAGTFQSATAHPVTTQKTAASVAASSTGYVYSKSSSIAQPSTFAQTTASSTYSGYDAALYSAASSYYQQQQVAKTGTTWKYSKGVTGQKIIKKPTPKQMQLHYCDVCKISCAGPQTYREHLEGQKHKKKEAAAKEGQATSSGRGQNQLRCELCDVACTGTDAYQAHIRGAKHQKVLKLHTMLGKPIPSTDPVVVNTASGSSSTAATSKISTGSGTSTKTVTKTIATATSIAKKVVTPKITFVGGSQLKSTPTGKVEEVKTEVKHDPPSTPESDKLDDCKKLLPGEKDVLPVGHEYIEEVKNELGKTISFNCKLCECKFNDPNAKEMHMKGRRHRLQYKKKVDPSLQVEVKPSIRARKIQEEKLRRQSAKEEYWRRRSEQEERWREEMIRLEEEQVYWGGSPYEGGWQGRGMMGPRFGPQGGPPIRRPDTTDDRHVMAKHATIYPNDTELKAVQNIVSACEKGLKLVSDHIAEADAPKDMKDNIKPFVKKEPSPKEEKEPEEKKEGEKPEAPVAPRVLKGVMRVGVLAKGLLLHEDLNVQLVVLCAEKPTRTLLERVFCSLPKHLEAGTEDKFQVKLCVEKAAVIVSSEKEPKATCTITLSSPVMRDENQPDGESVNVKDPPDVLDRQKCLDALAALRHAKWFQARANGLQSCVVVIRILRDLCQRVPTWQPLNQWVSNFALELMVEKCISSGHSNIGPGDALRRVFECIAAGMLLPGGPGLYDPCEKEPTDASAHLTPQEREDITASAQHALRLIAFRQIHKVLGMDQLPQPKFARSRLNPRKRRRTNSGGEGDGTEGGEGKKDKKEEEGSEGAAQA